jgi:acetyl-CoA carboxylase biotin carboxyl carrier protein
VSDAAREDGTGGVDQGDASARQALETVLLTPGVIEAVRSLVEIMDRGGLSKLDLVHGDLSVRLRSGGGGGDRLTASPATSAAPASSVHASPDRSDAVPDESTAPVSGEHVVTSPMVGTYYASPSPGAPPFVQVGDPVDAGQTVGIVEAMKIMNEIVAERGGIVTKILVENGQAVEYGSPLLWLRARPAGGPA